jgi:hypothetical protein
MKFAEGESQLASYTHKSPRHGTRTLVLTGRRLQLAQGPREDHFPLRSIQAVSLDFHRRRADLVSGTVLLLFVLLFASVMSWLQSNMPAVVGYMVGTAAEFGYDEGQRQVMLQQMTGRAQTLLSLFPLFWGLLTLSLAYALWLLYTGIRGETRLRIVLADGSHEFAVRGNNAGLMEFGQTVAQNLN